MTSEVAATLGKCRSIARHKSQASLHRAAGNEARAQHLEHRAMGEHVTAKARKARARELVAERVARRGESTPTAKAGAGAMELSPEQQKAKSYLDRKKRADIVIDRSRKRQVQLRERIVRDEGALATLYNPRIDRAEYRTRRAEGISARNLDRVHRILSPNPLDPRGMGPGPQPSPHPPADAEGRSARIERVRRKIKFEKGTVERALERYDDYTKKKEHIRDEPAPAKHVGDYSVTPSRVPGHFDVLHRGSGRMLATGIKGERKAIRTADIASRHVPYDRLTDQGREAILARRAAARLSGQKRLGGGERLPATPPNATPPDLRPLTRAPGSARETQAAERAALAAALRGGRTSGSLPGGKGGMLMGAFKTLGVHRYGEVVAASNRVPIAVDATGKATPQSIRRMNRARRLELARKLAADVQARAATPMKGDDFELNPPLPPPPKARPRPVVAATPTPPAPAPRPAPPRLGPRAESAVHDVGSAYQRLSGGRENVRVRIADIKEHLKDKYTSKEIEDALRHHEAHGDAALYRLDNPPEITARDRAAMMHTPSGEPRHIVYMGRNSASMAVPAASKPSPIDSPRLVPKLDRPDLPTFAARVQSAAARVGPEGRFGDNKVFISHAHAAYERLHGPMPLAEFKARLAEANNKRHLDLSRADMVEAMHGPTVKASETRQMGAEFHFIRTPSRRKK